MQLEVVSDCLAQHAHIVNADTGEEPEGIHANEFRINARPRAAAIPNFTLRIIAPEVDLSAEAEVVEVGRVIRN